VAFTIPDQKQTSGKEFQAISELMKDVGAALESIANTLADGVVEENELNATIPKLEAVIQECASVRYLLETLCKNRKKESEKVTRSGAFASQTGGPSSKESATKGRRVRTRKIILGVNRSMALKTDRGSIQNTTSTVPKRAGIIRTASMFYLNPVGS
jgi:hypothetical protein